MLAAAGASIGPALVGKLSPQSDIGFLCRAYPCRQSIDALRITAASASIFQLLGGAYEAEHTFIQRHPIPLEMHHMGAVMNA